MASVIRGCSYMLAQFLGSFITILVFWKTLCHRLWRTERFIMIKCHNRLWNALNDSDKAWKIRTGHKRLWLILTMRAMRVKEICYMRTLEDCADKDACILTRTKKFQDNFIQEDSCVDDIDTNAYDRDSLPAHWICCPSVLYCSLCKCAQNWPV